MVCVGGRYDDADVCAVVGTLEGYDQLMNLVLDHVKETMRGRTVYVIATNMIRLLTACR